MSRAALILRNGPVRERAIAWVRNSPVGTRVEFKAPRRSCDQNAKMWAMLTDIARQVDWYGQKLSPNDWKLMFLDGLSRETRAVPSLDGSGVVQLGRSSSDLSKDEMSELIELMFAFAADRDIVFVDETNQPGEKTDDL